MRVILVFLLSSLLQVVKHISAGLYAWGGVTMNTSMVTFSK